MTKLNMLATAKSPDYYEIAGEVITAHYDGVSETYDLSVFEEGGKFLGTDPVNGVTAIRDVERVDGELKVTLCQQVGPGHWSESDWFDAAQYDPDAIHVRYDSSKPHSGTPWAKTRQGKETV